MERTLQMITIHARTAAAGAMGGRAITLSPVGTEVRASVLPDGGDAAVTERGCAHAERIHLLVSDDVQVSAGDGAAVNGRMYIVRAVNRWRAHLELICEAKG